MVQDVYDALRRMAEQPEAQERACAYLVQHLSRFVKKMDTVLICFPQQGIGSLSHLMEQAVLLCGAAPVVWGEDHRWKTLLRLAFSSHAATVIGPPLIVLGLAKLCAFYAIPLFVRNVVTAGYPCEEWMIDGIQRGFDCITRGSFGLGITGLVAGFSCDKVRGIHLRDTEYQVEIVDREGNPVPEGTDGEMVLSPVGAPKLRYFMGENARLSTKPCACGCTGPLLTNIRPGRTEDDQDLLLLGKTLQSWNSVLDCRLRKGKYGLEIEVITLPDGLLPPLPTAAKRVVRALDPETDVPFPYDPTVKISENRWENH